MNKFAKLRRCANWVHFEKYSLDKYILEKYSLDEGKPSGDGGDLLGDGGDLLGDGDGGEKKFDGPTDIPTHLPTDLHLTWEGAGDACACASKKMIYQSLTPCADIQGILERKTPKIYYGP